MFTRAIFLIASGEDDHSQAVVLEDRLPGPHRGELSPLQVIAKVITTTKQAAGLNPTIIRQPIGVIVDRLQIT